jgi:hypothetical protein
MLCTLQCPACRKKLQLSLEEVEPFKIVCPHCQSEFAMPLDRETTPVSSERPTASDIWAMIKKLPDKDLWIYWLEVVDLATRILVSSLDLAPKDTGMHIRMPMGADATRQVLEEVDASVGQKRFIVMCEKELTPLVILLQAVGQKLAQDIWKLRNVPARFRERNEEIIRLRKEGLAPKEIKEWLLKNKPALAKMQGAKGEGLKTITVSCIRNVIKDHEKMARKIDSDSNP